jgi:hypothetical protein
VMKVAERGEERLYIWDDRHQPHPTCPRCEGHTFYVQDLPIRNSPCAAT